MPMHLLPTLVVVRLAAAAGPAMPRQRGRAMHLKDEEAVVVPVPALALEVVLGGVRRMADPAAVGEGR